MPFLLPVPQPVSAYDLTLPLLAGSVAHERCEAAAFIYCDEHGRLRGMRHVRSATSDMLDMPVRQIVIDALGCDARLVVMAHNHPSGEPWPSRADRDVTRRLAAALGAIDVKLHDHLIVAGKQRWSFRAAGLL